MSETILVLNAGSSTLKASLYRLSGDALPEHPPAPLWQATLDGTRLRIESEAGGLLEREVASNALEVVVPDVLSTLHEGPVAVLGPAENVSMVGHRVVHGGSRYREPVRVTDAVKAAIADLAPLAPAHNPPALAAMTAVAKALGETPQLAVFDTAFHQTIPEAAAVYPVPYAWTEQGVRRYGFHGISHQYAAGRAAELLGRDLASLRLVTCHLGNGCSLTAVRGGVSIDTTMGFTPLEGLMMGTRSGSVDPGLLLYMLRQGGYTPDELATALNKDSGLLGVSGLSGDMREVAAQAPRHPQAQLALDIYVHRVRRSLGAMLGSLGGLDALVFTAGVGENSALVRSGVCEAFAFLGLELDEERNVASPQDADVASPRSAVRALVIRAQENWAIARACWTALRAHA